MSGNAEPMLTAISSVLGSTLLPTANSGVEATPIVLPPRSKASIQKISARRSTAAASQFPCRV